MQPFNYNWLMLIFSLMCLVLLLIAVGFAIRFDFLADIETPLAITATVLVALMGAGLLLFIALAVKFIRDDRDFDQNGVLLVGSLSSIGGEWRRSSGKNRPAQYKVTVAYNVELPDGKIITETAWANRRDLEDFNARPKRGTPVAVQYSTTSKKIRLL